MASVGVIKVFGPLARSRSVSLALAAQSHNYTRDGQTNCLLSALVTALVSNDNYEGQRK